MQEEASSSARRMDYQVVSIGYSHVLVIHLPHILEFGSSQLRFLSVDRQDSCSSGASFKKRRGRRGHLENMVCMDDNTLSSIALQRLRRLRTILAQPWASADIELSLKRNGYRQQYEEEWHD